MLGVGLKSLYDGLLVRRHFSGLIAPQGHDMIAQGRAQRRPGVPWIGPPIQGLRRVSLARLLTQGVAPRLRRVALPLGYLVAAPFGAWACFCVAGFGLSSMIALPPLSIPFNCPVGIRLGS